MPTTVIEGDLLATRVDAIVNAWNRNIIPWWLLIPKGVSGAIKRHGGYAPFRELARAGAMPLGSAFVTSAGRLPYKGIIHVAGINMLWRASARSIGDSARNAVTAARARGWHSIAMPLIGSGSGGFSPSSALGIILDALANERELDVQVVKLASAVRRTLQCPVRPSRDVEGFFDRQFSRSVADHRASSDDARDRADACFHRHAGAHRPVNRVISLEPGCR